MEKFRFFGNTMNVVSRAAGVKRSKTPEPAPVAKHADAADEELYAKIVAATSGDDLAFAGEASEALTLEDKVAAALGPLASGRRRDER